MAHDTVIFKPSAIDGSKQLPAQCDEKYDHAAKQSILSPLRSRILRETPRCSMEVDEIELDNFSFMNYFEIEDDVGDAAADKSILKRRCRSSVSGDQEDGSSSEEEMFKPDTLARVAELAGDWGVHRFEKRPFRRRRSWVKMRHFSDLKLNEDEANGVLSERMIACCLSNLERVPELRCYAYCRLNLPSKNLRDVTVLRKYHFIQYLDVSNNRLSDLSAVGQLPFLQYLYANNNELETLLEFKAPFYLTYADFSHNRITAIPDLTAFWSLVHLDVSNNEIEKIQGLESLQYLSYLNLSFNRITVVENINHLRLQTLLMKSNRIKGFEEGGFSTLTLIRVADFEDNKIDSLRFFETSWNLQTLILRRNSVYNLMDVYYLRKLMYLVNLDLSYNPITDQMHYSNLCIRVVAHLETFDGEEVTANRRVQSRLLDEVEYSLRARVDRMELLLLEHLNTPKIRTFILPVEYPPPPMILIVGPPACRKKRIAFKFVSTNSHTVQGVSHSTRPKTCNEVEGREYYFVNDDTFDNLLRKGEFVTVSETFGYRYGITFDEIGKINEQRKVMVLYTDLTAALILKLAGFCPRMVLAMPRSEETHMAWLKHTYVHREISKRLSRIKNCPACIRRLTERSSDEASNELSGSSLVVASTMTEDDDVDSSIHQTSGSSLKIHLSGPINDDGSVDNTSESDRFRYTHDFPANGNSSKTLVSSHKERSNTSKQNGISICTTCTGATEDDKKCSRCTFCTASLEPRRLGSGNSKRVSFSGSSAVAAEEEADQHDDRNQRSISDTYLVGGGIREEDELHPFVLSVLSKHWVIASEGEEQDTTVTPAYFTQAEAFRIIQEEYLKAFYDEVIELRNHMLDLHNEIPGVFRDIIFTDDEDDAMDRLKSLLKSTIESSSCYKPTGDIKENPVFQKMSAHKLENVLRPQERKYVIN